MNIISSWLRKEAFFVSEKIDLVIVVDIVLRLSSFTFESCFCRRSCLISLLMLIKFSSSDRKSYTQTIRNIEPELFVGYLPRECR